MAKPWAEVAASPEFKSLPPDQQQAARLQYYVTEIAPNVPKEHLDDVWQQFDADTKGTLKVTNEQVRKGMGMPAKNLGDLIRGGPKKESLGESLRNYASGIEQGIYRIPQSIVEMGAQGLDYLGVTNNAAPTVKRAIEEGNTIANPNQGSKYLQTGETVGELLATVPASSLKVAKGVGVLARTANAAAQGGTAAALTSAGSDAPLGEQVATGTILGPLVAGAAKVATGVYRGVAGLVSPAARSQNAIRALASKVKMSPDDLTAALDDFQTQYGRQASISDVLDMQAKGRLQKYARDNPAFGAEVSKEADRRATQPPRSVTGNANQPMDESTLTSFRKQRMDSALKPIENNPVKLSTRVVDAILEPDVYESLPSSLKRKMQAVKDGTGTLTVRDMDNLRQEFAARAKPGERMRFQEYAKDIEALTTTAEPRYGAAMADYKRDSRFIDGFSHGQAGRSQTGVTDESLKKSLTSAEGQAGYALGTAEKRAADNLNDIAPNHIAPRDVTQSSVAHGAAAVVTGGPASRLYHALLAIPHIRTPDKTLRVAAKYLTDPTMARQGVNILRRAGATDADIARLSALVGGTQAGGAQ